MLGAQDTQRGQNGSKERDLGVSKMLPNQWKFRNTHFLSLNTKPVAGANNTTSQGTNLAALAGLVQW